MPQSKLDSLQPEQYESLKTKVRATVVNQQSDTSLATVRSLAKKFRLNQADILQVIEDTQLNLNVGIGTAAGTADIENKGDWTVECLNP